ncbi:YesL family protein [Bacillus sp. FJAT-27251]|uniref:YesL family protein n=1 Tax=Bacillus sp. FJAT-27251 TaxID=1684142 RepID=UPI0006A79F72|nr:YesL family protein [Bacillus sp. FJAT-27251]
MNGQYIVTTLEKIFTWITRLAAINLLWVWYTMMGLIAGGIFPATLTVLKICRKWIMGEKEVPIWSTFKEEYRRDFGQANLAGWTLTLAGMILYFNYLAIKSIGDMSIVVHVAFYLLILFYLNLVVWSFPQLAHYEGKLAQLFKNAVILGFGRFHYTVGITAYVFIVLYFSLKFPGLLPFFTVSLAGLGWAWLSMNLFKKLDVKTNQPLLLERVNKNDFEYQQSKNGDRQVV